MKKQFAFLSMLTVASTMAACSGEAPGEGGADFENVAESSEELRGGRLCGGPRDRECGARRYCERRGCDDWGVCQRRPQVCTDIYAPVCGCDGQTYGNECYAQRAGVSVAAEGPCSTACTSNADCGDAEYCEQPAGVCGGDGTCVARPEVCADIYAPVCGCDGKTHGNACEAAAAGTSVASEGECSPRVFCGGIAGFPCPGAGTCIDDPSDDCDPNQGGADCGGLCVCSALGLCTEGYVWNSSPEVCGCEPLTTGQPCGAVTCSEGLECCNASCGTCVRPGMSCIQIACD